MREKGWKGAYYTARHNNPSKPDNLISVVFDHLCEIFIDYYIDCAACKCALSPFFERNSYIFVTPDKYSLQLHVKHSRLKLGHSPDTLNVYRIS